MGPRVACALVACLLAWSGAALTPVAAQGGANVSPLEMFVADAVAYCTDTAATPVPPVSAATVECTTATGGLVSSIKLTSIDNGGASLPDSLFQLTALSLLSLNANNIGGSIPAGLSSLLKLTGLSLQGNKLTGSIPLQMSLLTKIESLSLGNNSMSGTLPSFLTTLSLKTLELNDNAFTGTVPAFLSIQPFTTMDLSNNLLYGAITSASSPACIANLDGNCFSFVACKGKGPLGGGQLYLESAACNATCTTAGETCSNPLGGVVVAVKTHCSTRTFGSSTSGHPGLSCLYGVPFLLDTTQFPKQAMVFDNQGLPIPNSISTLQSVGALVLDRANIGGSLPIVLTTLSNLIVLSLAANSIEGTIPTWLPALGALTELVLDENALRGTLPSSLGQISALRSLSLQDNALYGTLPVSLLTASNLGELLLENNQLSGGVSLSAVSAPRLLSGGLALASNFFVSFVAPPTFPLPIGGSGGDGSSSCAAFAEATAQNCFVDEPVRDSVNCSLSVQRDPTYSCLAFCSATSAAGMCNGHGYCYLDPDSATPTCDCLDGWVRDATRPGSCVDSTAANQSPPPPPVLNVTRALGYNQTGPSDVPEKYLNRWSRHLSRGYRNVNGAPGWVILSLSNWIAEKNQFAPAVIQQLPFQWSPAKDQGPCSSCWAHSVADSVAAAAFLASGYQGAVPDLATQLIQTCSPDNSSKGCLGGLPPNALDMVVERGLRPSNLYSSHPSCPAYRAAAAPYKIVMYEKIQFSGWFGLLLTASSQPVVVTIQANYGPLLLWSSNADGTNVFQDGGCYSGELDHTLVLVGYQLLSPTPYWVLRNSWGPDWGDRGYIRMAIQSPSYAGVCGLYVYPGYYPIPAPGRSDPCYLRSYQDKGQDVRTMNPCGGGICNPRPEWGNYSYTCDCTALQDFVAVNNTVKLTLPDSGTGITQTCAPVDACQLSLYNPCGVGTCINDGQGRYSCICPLAYQEDTLADGRRICSYTVTADQDPDAVLVGLRARRNFTVQTEDLTCYQVYVSYGLTKEQFLSNNVNKPLDCSRPLPLGTVLDVTNPSYSGCVTPYTITTSDKTCDDIAATLSISVENITAANPGINCTSLVPGMLICAQAGSPPPLYACLTQQLVRPGDTCSSIVAARFGSTRALDFYTLNPGINCDKLDGQQAQSNSGQQYVCLALSNPGTTGCKKADVYTTTKGDTCVAIAKKRKVAMAKIKPPSVCSRNPIPASTAVCTG